MNEKPKGERMQIATRAIQFMTKAVPALLLLLAVGSLVAGSDVDVRLRIATAMAAGAGLVVVVSLLGFVAFGMWRLLQREVAWIGKAFSLSCMSLGGSLLLLQMLPGVSAKLSLDRNMRVVFGSDYMRITGAMSSELPGVLADSMAPDYRPQRIYLENAGGAVAAGQDAATLLIDRGLDTAIIAGQCDSSCAYMALRFQNRYLVPGGALGFHDLTNAQPNTAERNRERDELIARLIAGGYRESVVRRMFATLHIERPALETLLTDGLITGCWDDQVKQPTACSAAAGASKP